MGGTTCETLAWNGTYCNFFIVIYITMLLCYLHINIFSQVLQNKKVLIPAYPFQYQARPMLRQPNTTYYFSIIYIFKLGRGLNACPKAFCPENDYFPITGPGLENEIYKRLQIAG